MKSTKNKISNELQLIAQNLQVAILGCKLDDKLEVSFANDCFFKMIGYSRKQFEEKFQNSLGAIVHPNHRSQSIESLKKMFDAQKQINLEIKLKREDGRCLGVLCNGLIAETGKESNEFFAILTDITKLIKKEEDLMVIQKNYEKAMDFSEIAMFKYVLERKELLLSPAEAEKYGVDDVVADGPELLIKKGIVCSEDVGKFREMYAKIDSGEPFASCVISAKRANGGLNQFALHLTNIFDENGNAIEAIGVRKNITYQRLLERENDFGKTMYSNKIFTYEANISRDEIVFCNKDWANEYNSLALQKFSALIEHLVQNFIHPLDANDFCSELSVEKLVSNFENKKPLESIEYRKKKADGNYFWFRKDIAVIQDKYSGDFFIRSYISDINDRKVREIETVETKKWFKFLKFSSASTYEVNLTKNLFLSGHENWGNFFHVRQSNVFSEMISEFLRKVVHPDDAEAFGNCFSRHQILSAFDTGETEIILEYRRPNAQGEYAWVRCSMLLFVDEKSDDIRGSAFIEEIDEEKKRELELIYKSEHDLLTGFLSKTTFEKYIQDFFATAEGKIGKHAFLIIDLDYFKLINDNFGHAFGDAVLSNVASAIKDLFRDHDILGRIGGDEFAVLMKNIQNDKIAIAKAKEMCVQLKDSFTKNNLMYPLSVSIGVAFYGPHGRTYEELYEHSDSALYEAKVNGRDSFSVYNQKSKDLHTATDEVDTKTVFQNKTFEEGVTEYVLRILCETQDKPAAINSVLELIGKHYAFSRSYVFEFLDDEEHFSNTFEWCDEGIAPQMNALQNMSNTQLNNYVSNFAEEGLFVMNDINKASEAVKEVLISQSIKSMLQFAFASNGKIKGFIGFDECKAERIITRKEAVELKNIADIIGMVVVGERALQKSVLAKKTFNSIINGLDSFAYVCDPESYKILYLNAKTLEMVPEAAVGALCYKVIRKRESPCGNCPMASIAGKFDVTCSMDIFNDNLELWVKATASWLDWDDGRKVCLVDSVDITKYVNKQ